MITANTAAQLRAELARLRQSAGRVAFVPTMGNLHAGHLRLVQEARRHAGAVVVSIYVNPLQFGENEDFDSYPRTPDDDRAALERESVALLFMPGDAEVYSRGQRAQTRVEVPGISDDLCGAFRHGHFQGVTTVVNRLFNLVAPDVALFGKKDYQQLLIIRTMVADLGMPVEIVGVETVREPDGLALSSRNRYLTVRERQAAPLLYRTLTQLRARVIAGRESLAALEQRASGELRAASFRPDYVSVRRQQDLAPPGTQDRELVALAAAWLGRTRLIDNVEFVRA